MEPHRAAQLLEKYFEGETTVAEEKWLHQYFASAEVAPELEMYKPLFGYFENEKSQQLQFVPIPERKRNPWISIAAAAIVLVSIGSFAYLNFQSKPQRDLGTYDNPERAFLETKKALALLSRNVNTGVEGIQHLKTYENTRERIFKQ
ncbi:hypothetical protein HYN48_07495 [Flavobacterium magnum]|uniref:Uncharacterized protein n=1 Tax=Flavobacterium magnum TaxID=2162713 RepID=A0A2S0RE81_9FLAO|nr:hypothetical protein [Flavobacterium magnum]AWA29934.1 hypothetical protein HYN48_07495 [Flavobacterium magnum]